MEPILELESARLLLRQWSDADLPEFAAMCADPQVMRYFPAPLSRLESASLIGRIRGHFAEHGFGLWALERKDTGAFIGFTGLGVVGFDAPFTPAVEISFIRPKHQKYIAVSIEGQQSSPSLSQAQKMRELDKEGKLNGDVIDGILSQEKKEVDKVIINSAELEKYFGKDKSPREMKDKIISLLDDWKAKQPPELGKPEKKTDLEK